MSTLYTVCTVAFIVFSLFFITIILLQKKRSTGMGTIGGLTNENNSMGRTSEDNLSRLTKICGVIFFVASIGMSLLN
ncbi:MAG: preprotein translocase subunit SecG [Lachnospirales bacterium]